MVFIYDRVQNVTLAVDGSNIKASDYSVFVRGLPKDVTQQEILDHFNALYDLGEQDWTFEGYRCWIGRKMIRRPREDTESRRAAKVCVQ